MPDNTHQSEDQSSQTGIHAVKDLRKRTDIENVKKKTTMMAKLGPQKDREEAGRLKCSWCYVLAFI